MLLVVERFHHHTALSLQDAAAPAHQRVLTSPLSVAQALAAPAPGCLQDGTGPLGQGLTDSRHVTAEEGLATQAVIKGHQTGQQFYGPLTAAQPPYLCQL